MNDRPGQYFRLALFDQNHRHALFDVFAGVLRHHAPASCIQTDTDGCATALLVEARLGIGHLVARNDQLLFDDNDFAPYADHALGTERRRFVAKTFEGVKPRPGRMFFGDIAQFEGCGATNNILGTTGVLHTR